MIQILVFYLKKLIHADYLFKFKLFLKDICSLVLLFLEDIDFVKAKNENIAMFFLQTYSNKVAQDLSKNILIL